MDDKLTSGLFAINNETGNVTTATELDFEKRNPPVYTLTVKATDKGDPPRSSQATIVVNVTDENDHRPLITKRILTATIPQTTATGLSLASLEAADDDSFGDNKIVSFFVVSGGERRGLLRRGLFLAGRKIGKGHQCGPFLQ